MRKRTILAVVLALGMIVMVGCGGDGAVIDTVPQSSANYTGPTQPAMLDSTTNTQDLGVNFLSDLSMITMRFGGGIPAVSLGTTSSSTSDFVEGGDGGSYTYSGSSSISWDETSFNTSVVQSLSFNDFADSGGVDVVYFEGPGGIDRFSGPGQDAASRMARRGIGIYYQDLQAGRGDIYLSVTSNLTTDGIQDDSMPAQPTVIGPVIPPPVGNVLTENVVSYVNFDSFFTSQGNAVIGTYFEYWQEQSLQSGFASANNMAGPWDTATMNMPFDDTLSADYALDYFSSHESYYSSQETIRSTQAFLGFDQSHAWNLSTATFRSSGTYCADGGAMSILLGCVDFDVSVTWNHDASTRGSCRYWGNIFDCYGWPHDGLVTLEADGASASFAFTPTGGTFTFDAGNGSDPFETTLSPPSPD